MSSKKCGTSSCSDIACEDDSFDLGEFFDSSEFEQGSDEQALSNVVQQMIEASTVQMNTALDLTRMVLECRGPQSVSSEEVFDLFKQSSAVVAEVSPLQPLLAALREEF